MHLKEVAARGPGASSAGFLPLNRPPVRRPGTKAPWEPADMTRYDRLAPRARSHVALPVDRGPLAQAHGWVDVAAKSQNRKDICHKLTAPLTFRKVFDFLGRNSKWLVSQWGARYD